MAPEELPIMFGAMLALLLPPPIRLLVRTVRARTYRRYISQVRSG